MNTETTIRYIRVAISSEGGFVPSLEYHLEFDEKRLKKNNVICDDTDGTSVHRRMDKNAKKYGSDHREMDYWHSPEGIRDMVDNIVASACDIYPTTATDYVRIAYGHKCLDYMASKTVRQLNCSYRDLTLAEWRSIFTRAYRLFRRNYYHKKKYQPRR